MQGQQIYQPQLFYYVNIEELIPQNHILRKIDKDFDLSFIRQLTQPFYCYNNGRPSIDPELFFRMVLVGYVFGIESDRRLCEEITYNLAYRWYCKLNLQDSVPDHSSLSKIRDRYGSAVFEIFFDKVVEICKAKGLVQGKRIITDSTLIEANASLDSMVNKEEQLQEVNIAQSQQHKGLSNKTHISSTDPDSTLARKAGAPQKLKYKVHTSIDAESRIILDNKVTTGSFHETNIYVERLNYIEEKYQLCIREAIADRAYGSADNILALRKKNISAYIPLFSTRSGQVTKIREYGFIYEAEHDRYKCPQGNYLLPDNKRVSRIIYSAKTGDCRPCPSRDTCHLPKWDNKDARRIKHSINQPLYEEQLEYMQQDNFVSRLIEKFWKIEGINAEAKNLHTLKRAKYRGLAKVQIQTYMVGAVQNLKRFIQATAPNIRSIASYLHNNFYQVLP